MDQNPNQRSMDSSSSYTASRRTAGETAQLGGENAVPEWQRNTWYGPAPSDENPFDEPEDAPELRSSRSENVNSKLGDFWSQRTTGYQYTGEQASVNQEGAGLTGRHQAQAPHKELQMSTVWKALGILCAMVVVALIVLRFFVFSVENIQVIGNSQMSAEEIIRVSGIRKGDSILSLDEKAVEERVESDYHLQFRYLEKVMPQTVILSVREREACCWLTYSGILYTMDKNRMVMFETEDLDVRPAELVEVKGLGIRSGCMVGQTMLLTTQEQQNVFSELFLEMKVIGCTAQIQEADLSNSASILLLTRDGFTVAMGDKTNIHAKLRAMMLVRQELQRLGYSGGTINVVSPESPYYSPSSV